LSFLARAGGLRPDSPTLQGAGFDRPLTTGFRIKNKSYNQQDFYSVSSMAATWGRSHSIFKTILTFDAPPPA
jgi:hypothetical protein